MRKIYLDMDGTIADLYGVENWLEDLIAGNERPYREAKRLVEETELAELVVDGYELAIVSWLAKNSNKEYDRKVRTAKREWLKANYPNIKFTEIHIVKYGTPKSTVANEKGILVDDETPNRKEWKGIAVDPKIFF